jgi:hypothetical protein
LDELRSLILGLRSREELEEHEAGRSCWTRGAADLERAARELGQLTEVAAIPGDVADDWHRTCTYTRSTRSPRSRWRSSSCRGFPARAAAST